jgi:hypothetical protein
LRDFLNAADLSPLSDQLIERYDDDSALQYAESLIYQPPGVVA